MTNIDDETDQFNEMITMIGSEMIAELVSKNTKYRSAYRKARQFCKEKYGDPTIPYELHAFEKQLRIDAQDDDEDARRDFFNYGVLEYICHVVDDQPTPEPTAPDVENGQPEKRKRSKSRRTKNGLFCIECGTRLIGHQEKYCSKRCCNLHLNRLRKRDHDEVESGPMFEPDDCEPNETRRCVVCNEIFIVPRNSIEMYCSKTCASTGRHRQRYGWTV